MFNNFGSRFRNSTVQKQTIKLLLQLLPMYEKAYRDVGLFIYKNKEGADAYVGTQRLTGRLKEIVCLIV